MGIIWVGIILWAKQISIYEDSLLISHLFCVLL